MNYYSIKITGKDVRRFIRNLHKMHINFYSIKYIDKSVIIKVNKEDYKKIKKIKTIYKVEVIGYYGVSQIKHFINIYKIFLISLFFGFIFLIFLTNIIFDVSVNHNNKELRDLILEELKENKISKYHFIVSFDQKEKIKNKILTKYNDEIEWLEINRIGTKYIVEVEERKKLSNNSDNNSRNVVAKKNGIITKIVSTNGEIVGKIDQYVKKGDVLISGTIHKKDNVVGTVKAEGKVLAETWYTVTTELPYHIHEEYPTGKSNKCIKVNILNKEYHFLDFKKYKNSNDKTLFGIKNYLLPIKISLEKKEEVNITDEVVSYDKALSLASSLSRKRLKDNLGEDIEIIFEKKLKYEEINSKIMVVMFYKVIEDITSYNEILENENNIEIR